MSERVWCVVTRDNLAHITSHTTRAAAVAEAHGRRGIRVIAADAEKVRLIEDNMAFALEGMP